MAHILAKIGRVLLTVVLSIVSLAVGLLVLVFVALAIPPLRALAVNKGVAYANTTLEGMTLKVKSVDRLDPWGINIKGVQLFDEKKRELVMVPWAMVRLNPFALVKNTLALTRVEVDGVRAHLYPADDKPEEEEPEEPASKSTFTIRADHVRVRDAQLVTAWDDRTLRARVGTLALGGQWGPKPALAIKEATIKATADDDVLLQLRTTEGAWAADRGGRIGIEAMVAGAPLTLKADVPALADVDPWPVRTAELRLHGLDRRALALLGVADGAELHVPVNLALDAQSKGERLEAQAKIRAGKAAIDLAASADQNAYELAVNIAPVDLATVAGSLPVMKVEGDLHALAWPSQNEQGVPEKLNFQWSNVAVDESAVPGGLLKAELPLPVVRLNSLTLAGMEEALAVNGEYDTERSRGRGEIDFSDFRLHAIEVLKKMGLAGTLNGGISANVGGSALKADGKLDVRGFVHPAARFQALDLAFAVGGKTTSPEGDFNLRVNELVAGDVKIDQITSEAHANTEKLTGRLQVRGPDTLMNAELGGQRKENGELRAQAIGRGHIAKRELHFDLRELLYGEGGVTVQELALFSGKQGVRLSGALDRRDNVHAEVKLANIDLREIGKLTGSPQLKGKLHGIATIDGTTSEPRIDSKINLADVQYLSKLPVSGTVELRGDLATRKADLKLALYSDEELGARASLAVALPKRPLDLGKAANHARIKAEVTAWLPMDQISALGGDQMAGIEGNLEANIKAEGTLDDPKLDADIRASLKLPEQDEDPVDGVHLTAKVDKEQAKLDVWAKDDQGELLTLNGFVRWPGGNPRAALERPAEWQNARFQAKAALKSRRFDALQGVFAYFSRLYALSLPIRAGGELNLEGNDGHLDGSAKAQLIVYGDKLDGRCKLGAQSSIDFDAKLKQDRVEVSMSALTDGGGKLTGKVTSALALNALSGGEPVIGPAKVTLSGKEIAIHKLPGLCNLGGGVAGFDAVAEGLGNQRPKLELKASVRDLYARGHQPMSVQASAQAGGKTASMELQVRDKTREIGTIAARVPLSYPDGTTPTVVPTAPIDAQVRFDKLPLANVLAFTEALGRVSGTGDVNLRVTGPLNNPHPEGFLQLNDVNASVAAMAQPFRDVNGRIEIDGRSVKIPKLTARDRDGRVKIEGFANLDEDLSGTAGLYLEADEFPLRQQGTIIGELTTRARLDVKIPDDLKTEATLKIIDGRIWLTGERGKNVQSLEPHPDVRYADEQVEEESTPAEEKAEGQGGALAIGSFRMQTERELWLMHKDFGLQVGVDIAILDGDEGLKMEGEATLLRGELQLLGKTFKLDKGAIRFGGPMPPDPELDIKAVFKPPTGEDLVVQVSGRASAPALEFSGAATTVGEAVAVLTGRGLDSGGQSKTGAENDAATQMAGMAADMTAGLLIMTARREFGDWVPMIEIQTGDSGEPTGARAGFDASKLIPPWLDGFAKGAYVEGTIGGDSQGGGQGGSVGYGVRLEVALPRDVVTSLGYGTGSWSTDVAWAP